MGSLQFYSRKRKRERTSKDHNLNDLPQEILSDILSRLPLTSLPQLKPTCKLWYNLLPHPTFSDLHLYTLPAHLYTLPGHSNLYFADTTSAIRLPRQAENDDLGEDSLYTTNNKRSYLAEYASCNGLVCYSPLNGRAISVFNPIIREHVRLPDRPFQGTLRWGFGFAPITKKYKCYCYSANKTQDNTLVTSSAVYTLGDESWREIDTAPFFVSRQHVYCKGALYWAIENENFNRFPQFLDDFQPGYNVLCLDLETEKFRERRVNHEYETQQFYLTVIGETVAAVLRMYNGLKVLLLIDEKKDIWELKYTIPFRLPASVKYMYELEFFGLWMNRVLCCRERVTKTTSRGYEVRCFSYSPCDKKFSPLHLPFAGDVDGDAVSPQLIMPHVGSLVSPVRLMTAAKLPLATLI